MPLGGLVIGPGYPSGAAFPILMPIGAGKAPPKGAVIAAGARVL